MIRPLLLLLLLLSSSFAKDFKLFELIYTVHIPKTEGNLSVWVPLPQNSVLQEIIKENIHSNFSYQITEDPIYKNRMLFIKIQNPEDSKIIIKTVIKRFEANEKRRDKRKYLLREALKEKRYIPINEKIKNIALRIVGKEKTPLERARKLYYHTLDTLEYDKSVPGWGRGDFFYAREVCKGNCTDFHTYFITLARNIDIPAIFEIGFPIPKDKKEGTIKGYHCWASFWDGEKWIPVDISEADKNPSKKDYYFGHLDFYRVSFTIGRDLKLKPLQKGRPLNYFIYPYVELNQKPYRVKYEITFKLIE